MFWFNTFKKRVKKHLGTSEPIADYVGVPASTQPIQKELHSEEWALDLIPTEFEGHHFPASCRARNILTLLHSEDHLVSKRMFDFDRRRDNSMH